jgi:hypothetical protein
VRRLKRLRAGAQVSARGRHVVIRLPGANDGGANEKSGGTATSHPALARSCSELLRMTDGRGLEFHRVAFRAGRLVGGVTRLQRGRSRVVRGRWGERLHRECLRENRRQANSAGAHSGRAEPCSRGPIMTLAASEIPRHARRRWDRGARSGIASGRAGLGQVATARRSAPAERTHQPRRWFHCPRRVAEAPRRRRPSRRRQIRCLKSTPETRRISHVRRRRRSGAGQPEGQRK